MLNDELFQSLKEYCQSEFGSNALTCTITGSQAVGLATSGSDIDLVVVISNEALEKNYKSKYVSKIVDDKIAEALVMSESNALRIVTLLKSSSYNNISAGELDIMRKFSCSIPVTGCGYFNKLMADISMPESEVNWFKLHRRNAVTTFDDVCGALADNDYMLAVEFFRYLLNEEINALLCTFGDIYSRPKWITRRVEKINSLRGDFHETFLSINFLYGITKTSDLRSWLNKALAFHKELQFRMFSKAYQLQISDAYSGEPCGNSVVSACPMFFLEYENEWIIKTLVGTHVVDAIAAEVLLLAFGPIQCNALVDSISGNLAVASSSVTTETRRRCIDKLLDIELLVRHTSTERND